MQIRVLGCSGSMAKGCRTTSFLLDDDILIDAGTGVGDLTLEEMAGIDHILVSHSHLDHVLAIGLLADSVARLRRNQRRGPIQVHALQPTLEALRAHVFNGVIWPDFTRLPKPEAPLLQFCSLRIGQQLQFGERHIEVLPAVHTVPAAGYAVRPAHHEGYWVYTGDTGPNPGLWERLSQMQVDSLVIETAFSDEESEVAAVSHHLCPSMLGQELARLGGSPEVHITHIKPGETVRVMAQIQAQDRPLRIRALSAGQVMPLGKPVTIFVN